MGEGVRAMRTSERGASSDTNPQISISPLYMTKGKEGPTSEKIFGSFCIMATASVDGVEYSCSLIHLSLFSLLAHCFRNTSSQADLNRAPSSLAFISLCIFVKPSFSLDSCSWPFIV